MYVMPLDQNHALFTGPLSKSGEGIGLVFMLPVISLNQGAQAGAFRKRSKPRSVQKITHTPCSLKVSGHWYGCHVYGVTNIKAEPRNMG
jgi:hypothetical protein